MGNRFAEIAFTPSVRAVQKLMGSSSHYVKTLEGEPYNQELGPDEAVFIGLRDTFYMASVSETGWPYVQHRGGPPGFIKVLDDPGASSSRLIGVAIGGCRAAAYPTNWSGTTASTASALTP